PVKKVLLALLLVGGVTCWAGVPSVHAQNTFMDGNMPASGVNVVMIALLGKVGSGSTGVTDSNGVPSNITAIMNSGATELYEYLCRDNKTVKLVAPGQSPDDAPPPCPSRWRRLGGAYFPGRGAATTQIGSGAGVHQAGRSNNLGGNGPYNPGTGEFWF